ncbi:hypothetical protein J4H86_01685 [Spiractinospora alimapuensis]|uniref:hypothetical protein n=1 Tax=Spiractinospora alimapuensis TaxID=2820884 RepID=UPI001F4576DB|nr:hypothetical protein [Spiractinospora alimapuensis]QVQ52577.1 hypothetical protein J4H86_01685 [Spiractinospora alimapuensis]
MHDPDPEALRQATRALADAARREDATAFADHTTTVCLLAEHCGDAHRTRTVAVLGDALDDPEVGQGAAADLATVIHAVLALGGDAHPVGPAVLRRLEECVRAASRFEEAWRSRSADPPPEGEKVTAAVEQLLAAPLGVAAAREVTMAWWTLGRFAAAAGVCLGDAGVRAWLRRRPELLARLWRAVAELGPVRADVAELGEALEVVGVASTPPRSAPRMSSPTAPPPPQGATPDASWGPSWRSGTVQRRWEA